MTDSIAMTDWINIILTIAIVVIALQSWRIASRVQWLTGAMERHSDQQRQIAAKQAGVEMIWWDKNRAGEFPHKGEHGHVHRLNRIHIGIPEHLREVPRWLPGRRVRLVAVAGVTGMVLLVLFKWVYPVTIDNLGWHGDVTGVGFLLLGLALGVLIRPSP